MATNLRLREDAASALQEYSARTGLSQQEVLRRALDAFLEHEGSPPNARDEAPAGGRRRPAGILPPRHPFTVADRLLELPPGMTTSQLLDRDDRI
ncbi:ribbon-helix-helix protein, CopG family [Agromyces neolithicus]|uniref:ribbon-helix-helix protein, CopG family n=1 Tax=Agromyces neolithicus TaxID=269420 RepID=UPI0031CE831F